MKNVILSTICVLFLFISGCTSVIHNAPAVVSTGTVVYAGHDAVVDVIRKNIDAFSPREVARLKVANGKLCAVKESIDAIVNKHDGNVGSLVMELPSLIPLYEEAKLGYIEARTIIEYRMHEFSAADQAVFAKYNASCIKLDSSITKELESNDGTDNTELVKDIVTFAIFVGKIVIPLLL